MEQNGMRGRMQRWLSDRETLWKGLELLLLLTGIYGILFLFLPVEELSWNPWLVYPAAAVLAAGLWGLSLLKRRWPLRLAILLLLAVFGVPLFQGAGLRSQLMLIFRCVLGQGQAGGLEATDGMVFLGAAVSLLVFLLEHLCRTHWPLYLLTSLLVLVCPLLGIHCGLAGIFLLLAFQVVFWAVHGLKRAERKKRGAGSSSQSMTGKMGVISLTAVSALFGVSCLAVGWNSDALFGAAYQAEGAVQRALRQITGEFQNPSSGLISRGNLYPAGTEQLELRTDREPGETLYLKGFTGGDYSRGIWQPADEEAVFMKMEENTLHWDQWSDWIPGMYESLYFVMNTSSNTGEATGFRNLFVEQLNSADNTRYLPYYSMRGWRTWQSQGRGYSVRFFEHSDMAIDWDSIEAGFETNRDWYYELQQAYSKEAAQAYTQVSQDAVPRLMQLCRENPLEDLDEITAFILYTLQSRASYTRTPGMFPLNEDPVEYFLFDGQEGYCQHFAAAAVLMYRLYGIPARYAAGYAVSPDDFQLQEDGTYYALVTDEDAHAWPEIFLEDYGWTPVEVTPAGAGISGGYPGMDTAVLSEILAEQDWSLDGLQPAAETQVQTENEASAGTDSALLSAVSGFRGIDGGTAAFLGICLVLLAAYLYLFCRASARSRMEAMDSPALFARLVEALHFSGRMEQWDGLEQDFPQKLAEELPGISQEQISQVVLAVNREAFGDKKPSRQETERARSLYEEVVRKLYGSMRGWKRAVFRYVRFFF